MKAIFYLILFLVPGTLAAQQSYALKPYAITLPKVNSAQQVNQSTVPQAEANVVYNTDAKALSYYDGSNWQLLGSDVNNRFPNVRTFQGSDVVIVNQQVTTYNWTVPQDVTQFVVEVWGGGAGGGTLSYSGSRVFCQGGGAGGYVRRLYNVAAGVTSTTIEVGNAGAPAVSTNAQSVTTGNNSTFRYNNSRLVAEGGDRFGSGGRGSDSQGQALIFQGGFVNQVQVSYVQKTSTDFMELIKLSDGGLAYGVTDRRGGFAPTVMLNSSGQFVRVNGDDGSFSDAADGQTPGGGGGCGYTKGGDGAPGLVIIRW